MKILLKISLILSYIVSYLIFLYWTLFILPFEETPREDLYHSFTLPLRVLYGLSGQSSTQQSDLLYTPIIEFLGIMLAFVFVCLFIAIICYIISIIKRIQAYLYYCLINSELSINEFIESSNNIANESHSVATINSLLKKIFIVSIGILIGIFLFVLTYRFGIKHVLDISS